MNAEALSRGRSRLIQIYLLPWHLGFPARKRCWNIFPAHRIFFQSRERESSVLFYIKVMLVLFKKKGSLGPQLLAPYVGARHLDPLYFIVTVSRNRLL